MSGNKAQNSLWECKTANSVVRLMTDAWSSTDNYHMYKDAEKYKIRSKIIPLKMTHNWRRQLGYWTGLTVTTAKMCCSHAGTWFIKSQRLGTRGRVVEKNRLLFWGIKASFYCSFCCQFCFILFLFCFPPFSFLSTSLSLLPEGSHSFYLLYCLPYSLYTQQNLPSSIKMAMQLHYF